MDALTKLAAFTAGIAFATGIPTNVRANLKPELKLEQTATAIESIAIRTEAALSNCSRQFKEFKLSLADAACLAAGYLRVLGLSASYRGKAAGCVKFAARRDPNPSQLTSADAVRRRRASAHVTEETASAGGSIVLEVPVVRIKRLNAKPVLCRHGMNGFQAKRYTTIGNDSKQCHRDGSI